MNLHVDFDNQMLNAVLTASVYAWYWFRLGKHTAMHMCPLLLVEFEFWSQQQATLTQIWAENVSPVLSSLV